MVTIQVNTDREYKVLLGKGLLAQGGELIRQDLIKRRGQSSAEDCRRVCVVCDDTVKDLYGGEDMPLFRSLKAAGFDPFVFHFPGGEENKTMATVEGILDHLSGHRFTRSDLLIALGGGIPGDITGFAAAIYQRGIDFVQMPTTLLSAVDSSVGGKTGVNLPAGKNLAGAFWQPNLVCFDESVLKTLPQEQLLNGMAELLKSGLISDFSILRKIMEYPDALAVFDDTEVLPDLIVRAIHVKRRIVEEDEREAGIRQLLNLGHTIGHAIEKCSDYQIPHGFAVIKGLVIVSRAADRLGWCEPTYVQTILSALEKFPYDLSCSFSAEELAAVARGDKKSRGTHITLVIPDYPGHAALKSIPAEDLTEFIRRGLT